VADLLDELLEEDERAPASSGPPPMEEIDHRLRNNLEVKKCFFRVKQTQGVLPARIDVSFNLSASGSASDIYVNQIEWVGTDLESCLSAAIRGISFPTSGGSNKLTYPFILQ
jgi:hypothetical protein